MSATRAVPDLVVAALAQVARLRMAHPLSTPLPPRNIGPAESGTVYWRRPCNKCKVCKAGRDG
jgi:hypothetical protein